MQTYQDKNGLEHRVDITLAARRRVQVAVKIDLLQCAADPNLLNDVLTRITEDDDYFFELLSAIEQIPKDDLLNAADGTTLESSATAFVNALIDFFPQSSPMREPLRTVVQKSMAFRAAVLESIQDEMTKQIDKTDFSTVGSESAIPRNGSGDSAAA